MSATEAGSNWPKTGGAGRWRVGSDVAVVAAVAVRVGGRVGWGAGERGSREAVEAQALSNPIIRRLAARRKAVRYLLATSRFPGPDRKCLEDICS
jgi:hypothetical protein